MKKKKAERTYWVHLELHHIEERMADSPDDAMIDSGLIEVRLVPIKKKKVKK